MKLFKKIAAIMLSIMMVLGMASVVSAAEGAGATTSGTSATTKGKITIDNAISGQTYKIYQILELESFSGKPSSGANTGNYAYKVVSEWNEFITTGEGNAYLESTDGYVKWKGTTDDARVAEFAKKALAYATNKNLTATKTEDQVTTKTVEFTDLALGYYLVDSSAGALCSLNTTDTDVTIQEKNDVPSVKKEVQEDSTSAWGDSNTADIGQTVNFQTTITAQPGAIFTLSKTADGANLIKLVSDGNDATAGDIYRVAKADDANTVTEVTTPASGKFTIKGLDADTYYLTETQQPAGYNKLSAPITVVIDENGNITVGANNVDEVKVENNTGSILPSTGGSGTTLIYILGAILVLGSSVVLITKKRMR